MDGKAIGIDLGGTFIKAGVVAGDGSVASRAKLPTEAPKGRATVIRNIAAAADRARQEAGLTWRSVRAVGLGAPGVFSLPKGVVEHCPNLPCLEGKELANPVARALGRPKGTVVLDNDANVAAYAESWIGAGRDVSTLVLMTLGTGIGGGIVLNNEIWRGAWGAAGELGHQVLFPNGRRCGCGNRGCLETYASATALVRRFKEAIARGKKSGLASALKSGAEVTARDIYIAAKTGDRTCLALMEETGRFLGIAVTNMLHVLNVERVVFTGGMTATGTMLLKPIREEAKRRAFPLAFKGVRIGFSRLSNDAGMVGAAGWALKRVSAAPRRSGAR